MKKLALIVVLSFAVVSVNAQAVKIMPLGNSITQADNSHYSYRYNLWQKLNNSGSGVSFDFVGSMNTNFNGSPAFPNAGFDRDHEGHWGWFADQLLNGLPGWLANYTPDVVLLHAGSNDAFNFHSTSSTVAELEQIIDVLRADNSRVIILLAKLIPVNNPPLNTNIIALNAQIAGIVSRKNSPVSPVILVDQNTGFNAASDTYDGVHPNSSGEEKMAQKWFDAIMALDLVKEETPSNAPHAISLSLTTNEDVPLFLTTSLFDAAYSDVDGDKIETVKILSQPDNAQLLLGQNIVSTGQTLSLSQFCSMQVRPKLNINGSSSFKIESTDGRGLSATHDVTVKIVPINDAPSFGPFQMTQKDAKVMYFEATVFDVDNPISALTFSASSSNQAVVADRNLSFTVVGDRIRIKVEAFTQGTATLQITVNDGVGTGSAVIPLTIVNTPHTMNVGFEVNEDETLVFRKATFIEAFTDVDGDELTSIKIVKLPLSGTLRLDGSNVSVGAKISLDKLDNLRFIPALHMSGSASFTIESIDARDLSVSHDVKISILPVNDPPTIGPFKVTEKKSRTIYLEGLIADVDHPISLLTFSVSSNNQNVVADDNISFMVVGDKLRIAVVAFNEGSAILKITVNDGTHLGTAFATVSVTNTPHTMNVVFKVNEDETLVFHKSTFVEAFTDVDGDELASIKIVKLPLTGTLRLDGSNVGVGAKISVNKLDNLRFIPALHMSGSASFTIESIDARDLSVAHEVKISILPVNDPPALGPFKVTERNTKEMHLEGLIADVDHPVSLLTFSVSSNNQTVVADDDISFKVVGDKLRIAVGAFNEGTATLKITANDGTHLNTAFAHVSITNTPHTMNLAFTVNEDETLVFHTSTFVEAFEDVDGDHLQQIEVVKLPLNGMLVLGGTKVAVGDRISIEAIDQLTFVPDANVSGETSFIFESIDGRDLGVEIVSAIHIEAVNDAPELAVIDDKEISIQTIDEVITVPLIASDIDTPASSLLWSVFSDAQDVVPNANLSIDNSILSIRPSDIGAANITVAVSDGDKQSIRHFIVNISLITDINSERMTFHAFPNPAEHQVSLSFSGSAAEMQYYIVDNRGTIVLDGEASGFDDNNVLRISVSDLRSGVYVIKCLFRDGQEKSVKFVKK